MALDLRQVVAGILTVTMFVMLGNMIKREHFDSFEDFEFASGKVTETGLVTFIKKSNGPWMEIGQEQKLCWTRSSLAKIKPSNGFITLSLTNGPEYHVSQIADAVVVAQYTGATLVIPDIRGNKPGDEREFGEIYDVGKFEKSLEGVIKVARSLPQGVQIRNIVVSKVPHRVTEDQIAEQVEPILRTNGNVRLATHFPSSNMRNTVQGSGRDSVACLAMYGALELNPEVNEVINSMIKQLQSLSRKTSGHFIAVDLKVELLNKVNCRETRTKSCYDAYEIAVFLRKVGFNKDTAIYITQSKWDKSMDILRDIFPNTHTKESIIAPDKKAKFLLSEDAELEKIIDFYICSQSDVFVPSMSGLFYANVVGKRIASGKTQILVPADIQGSSGHISNYFSPYISKRNHLAYSCFC